MIAKGWNAKSYAERAEDCERQGRETGRPEAYADAARYWRSLALKEPPR